jgi:hypothetical protein
MRDRTKEFRRLGWELATSSLKGGVCEVIMAASAGLALGHASQFVGKVLDANVTGAANEVFMAAGMALLARESHRYAVRTRAWVRNYLSACSEFN